MAEVEWSEEGEEPARKKKRVPTWVWWGCGGGCLLATLVAVALVVASVFAVRTATDPEKQWPRLGQVLAFDQRPADLELEFGMNFGAQQFHLVDHVHEIYATVTQYPGSGREYEQMLDPDFHGFAGLGAPADPEAGTLSIQGREVRTLRYSRIKPEPESDRGMGPGIRLDLTGEQGKPRLVELRRLGSDTRIEDAEVETFLVPFDVWRGR